MKFMFAHPKRDALVRLILDTLDDRRQYRATSCVPPQAQLFISSMSLTIYAEAWGSDGLAAKGRLALHVANGDGKARFKEWPCSHSGEHDAWIVTWYITRIPIQRVTPGRRNLEPTPKFSTPLRDPCGSIRLGVQCRSSVHLYWRVTVAGRCFGGAQCWPRHGRFSLHGLD